MKNKKAAMEMSVGTIVTIVLLMSVLVLGVVLVQKIFKSATSSIDDIDQSVKNEISKLFSQDESKRIVIYPSSRKISIKKGEQGQGFAFSIRNVGKEADSFTYEIAAEETGCKELNVEEADNFIELGRSGEIKIPAGQIMENPKLVTFNIPGDAPPCPVSYLINVEKGGEIYTSVSIILNIKGE